MVPEPPGAGGPARTDVADAIHAGPIQALTAAILMVGQIARDADPDTARVLEAVESDLVAIGQQLRDLMDRLGPEPPR